MSSAIHRIQRSPARAVAYALGAATTLYVGGKALRKGFNAMFPSRFPGETNTLLVATPVASGGGEELGDVREYDYIIRGGTAGCVIAARLTEDPSVKVLVIEPGESDAKQLFSRIPAAFGRLFNTAMDWDLLTTEQTNVDNRKYYWPRGKMLGGSSAMNAMIYQRGAPEDYDEWERMGNKGWGYSSVERLFRKAEGFHESNYHSISENSEHGTSGPWKVSYSHNTPVTKTFLKACNSVGIPAVEDVNTSKGSLGASLCQTSISPNGERSSTSVSYLTPSVAARKNLKIAVGQTVTKLFFENGKGGNPRVVGVEMASKKGSLAKYRVRAKREVIVCAGAVHSPQVLMCSGIGPREELEKYGIPVVKDLPGVGKNLQDHLAVMCVAKAAPGTSLQYLTDPIASLPALFEWLRKGTGSMASNVAEAFAFVKAKDHGAPQKVEDLSSGPRGADLELLMGPACYINHGRTLPPKGDYTAVGPVALRPKSRGTVTLASNSPFDAPIIDANYLAEESDREMLVFGCKLARKVMKSGAYSENFKGWYYPANFDSLDDAQILEHIKEGSETLYHPVGSMAMGPDPSKGAVVDDRLRVWGVEGLRVADAAIMPRIVAGHTCAPTVMIGEKAAELIKEDSTQSTN